MWGGQGMGNQIARSQMWFLTKKGRKQKKKTVWNSAAHQQQPCEVGVFSLLVPMQRAWAASSPSFVIRIYLLAGGTFLSFLLSVCLFSLPLYLPLFQGLLTLFICFWEAVLLSSPTAEFTHGE